MRSGLLPSQQRALRRAFKKADKFDHFRQRSRRTLLLGGCAALLGSLTTYWAGTQSGRATSEPPREHARLHIVRRLAAASDTSLWAQRTTYLQAVEEVGSCETGWLGIQRLATMTLARGPEEATFAARLLKSLNHNRPSYLDGTESALQALVR